MNAIEYTARQLRMVHGTFLVSMLLYAWVGEKVGPAEPRDLKWISRALAVNALLVVGVALVTRMRLLGPAEQALRLRGDDSQALGRWRAGHLVSMVLCEAVALFGFALRMLGGTFLSSLPFYAVAVLLMLVWAPRLGVAGPGQA